jgi:hypothetical protein
VDGMHAATSKVENSAQGSSCKLKFVHALTFFSLKKINFEEEQNVSQFLFSGLYIRKESTH